MHTGSGSVSVGSSSNHPTPPSTWISPAGRGPPLWGNSDEAVWKAGMQAHPLNQCPPHSHPHTAPLKPKPRVGIPVSRVSVDGHRGTDVFITCRWIRLSVPPSAPSPGDTDVFRQSVSLPSAERRSLSWCQRVLASGSRPQSPGGVSFPGIPLARSKGSPGWDAEDVPVGIR